MDHDDTIEEGEISNDSDGYTPLERPSNYSSTQPNPRLPVVDDTESEIESESSESSDSDSARKKMKTTKVKIKPKLVQPKRKKYDVWSTRMQTDLTHNLDSCDVTVKEPTLLDAKNQYSGKRTREEARSDSFKPRKRESSVERPTGVSRRLLDLVVTRDSGVCEVAQDIANKLYEEKEDLILRVVNVIGVDKALELFKRTSEIEQRGGMLIMNQTRRRTPGGVFLSLVRTDADITREERNSIFDTEKQRMKQEYREKERRKMQKIKDEIAASRNKVLPDLLTRAEILYKENQGLKKEVSDGDVVNPPPTPETDGHDNSGDGMDGVENHRVVTYDDDFLDINCSNDMDLF